MTPLLARGGSTRRGERPHRGSGTRSRSAPLARRPGRRSAFARGSARRQAGVRLITAGLGSARSRCTWCYLPRGHRVTPVQRGFTAPDAHCARGSARGARADGGRRLLPPSAANDRRASRLSPCCPLAGPPSWIPGSPDVQQRRTTSNGQVAPFPGSPAMSDPYESVAATTTSQCASKPSRPGDTGLLLQLRSPGLGSEVLGVLCRTSAGLLTMA
jgi:hypothetical protein